MAEIPDSAVASDARDRKVGHAQLPSGARQSQLVDERRSGAAGSLSDDAIDVFATPAGERGEARHTTGERVRILAKVHERVAEPGREGAGGRWLDEIVE